MSGTDTYAAETEGEVSDEDVISVRAKPSFIRLVYAFALEPGGTDDPDHIPAAEVLAQLKDRVPACGWEDREILYDYVLPHLADHMNAQDERDSDAEVGHWWRYAAPLPKVWRLRVGGERLVDLVLNGVELVFFRTGIGMLLLEIDPVSTSLRDWQDVLHLTRFYGIPRVDSDEGTRTSSVFARRAPRLEPCFDEEGADPQLREALVRSGKHGFGKLITWMLDAAFGDRRWTRASVPGLLAPFSAFFVDWADADEQERNAALYRWRRQLRSSATVAAEGQDDLHAELRPYAAQMWLAYSSEGGGFFGADAPDVHFFQEELPNHLRRPYAFGYLLALHQRLALSRFSERVGRVVAGSRGQWTTANPPRGEIARLQDDFLEYLTRCHFAQVLRTTNHHANYKMWETTLEVSSFAAEVELELRHLYERAMIAERIIDERRRAHLSGRLNAAVLGIAFPTVVLAILAVAYPTGLNLLATIGLTLAATVAGGAIGWVAATDRAAHLGSGT